MTTPPFSTEAAAVQTELQHLQETGQRLREAISGLADPFERAALATLMTEWLLAERDLVQQVRVEAVTELWPAHSYSSIARRIGRSKSLAAALAREGRGRDPRYRRREA